MVWKHLLDDGHTFYSLLVLAVQELVDFEHIDGIEWSQESEDEEDENVEGMDVAEWKKKKTVKQTVEGSNSFKLKLESCCHRFNSFKFSQNQVVYSSTSQVTYNCHLLINIYLYVPHLSTSILKLLKQNHEHIRFNLIYIPFWVPVKVTVYWYL